LIITYLEINKLGFLSLQT